MIRRRQARVAAALAAVALVAGCGGGGSGGSDSADAGAGAGAAVTPPAAGVAAAPTDALFGTPEAVDSGAAAESLDGYEEFGTPKDAFVQLVREDDGSDASSEPDTGAVPSSTPPPTPVTTDPYVAVPPSAVPVTPTTPTTTGPTTTPAAPGAPANGAPPVQGFEADFDIGGEPVVARLGDAIPPDTQQFTIKSITAGQVVLELNGGLLPDGSDTVTLKEGESITLVNQTTRTTYRVKLLDVRKL